MRALSVQSFLKFFALLFIGLMCLSLDASDASANAAWKTMQGHSACGGLDQNGNLQAPCGFSRADFVKQSIKRCPQGAFPDLGTCWQCPEGFNRNSLRPIDHERACAKPAPVHTTTATYLSAGKCPSGTVYDDRNGGECWRCDAGFGRTLAPVNEWNACGRIGAQARSASFVTRACPVEGSFRDPRNGGECWTCPEDYNRTGNPVTGANACKIDRNFAPAINRGDFACGPGEIFDFIDGGTCWKCPDGGKRTFDSVKSATACRLDRMQWVMPNRQTYGIFGLGGAADDILAKMIADRTQIEEAITKLAVDTNEPEATVRRNVWSVIDSRPEKSPVLSALLQKAVMDLANKPVAQQTADEKALLARIAQLIQWDRQFIAYQAKQAHETWVKASQAYYEVALSKMGAAAVYADSMVTPPDYNEILAGSIQVGAGVVGPVGAAVATTLWKDAQIFIRPFAKAAQEAAKKAVKAAALAGTETAEVTGSAAAASAGPLLIAAAAAVIVTMEIDKFMALERAEGQIANSIRIADRPVDLGALLRSPDGPDEFLVHWAAVLGAETRPSANFKARLAAYKAGTNPDAAGAAQSIPTAPSHGTSSAGMTTGVTSTQMVGGLPGMNAASAPAPAPDTTTASVDTKGPKPSSVGQGSAWTQDTQPANALGGRIQQAVLAQPRKAPAGAMHIEVSNRPGLCIAKKTGTDSALQAAPCTSKQTLWIAPDTANNVLVAAEQYCFMSDNPTAGSNIALGRCPAGGSKNKARKDAEFKWQLTQEGFIQQLDTNLCMTLSANMDLGLQACGSQRALQIWRPLALTKGASAPVNNRNPGKR